MQGAKLILIADDDDVNCKIQESIIANHTGYKSIRAKNGIEAVHLAMVNYRINLILMDILMPVLNGYDATKRIKQIRPNLPIIVVSALGMKEDREKTLAAGCNDFIHKPIDLDDFLSKINKYLR